MAVVKCYALTIYSKTQYSSFLYQKHLLICLVLLNCKGVSNLFESCLSVVEIFPPSQITKMYDILTTFIWGRTQEQFWEI